jgi:hypothetical protein
MKAFKPRSLPEGVERGWSRMPRIVLIPSPIFGFNEVVEVGRAIEAHLDVIIAIDDEWKDLIPAYDDVDLMHKVKTNVLDAISGCIVGVGNVCPAVVLHRTDIVLLWLVDDGSVRFLSIKEMIRRKELLYAHDLEPSGETKLLRLQTYRPLEPKHSFFFNHQFENLELEFYEMLYSSRGDVERWRRITGATTLPAIAKTVTEATRRFVLEFCVFGEYNVCPGILLLGENRVDVKILKIASKSVNYVTQIDLAGLLASR